MRKEDPSATVRGAVEEDLDALARLWFDGWQDAHAAILPAEIAKHQTLASFRERLVAALSNTRALGPPGAPSGMATLKDDELYQFYVAESARGTGAAGRLMDDALAQFSARGVSTAWLACAIGNDRAARFYEKSGWHSAGVMTNELMIDGNPYPLRVWRYERAI